MLTEDAVKATRKVAKPDEKSAACLNVLSSTPFSLFNRISCGEDMLRFYKKLREKLKEGKAFVLMILVKRRGSAPRDIGAKMVLFEDGDTLGSVGGGRVEALALEEAKGVLGTGEGRLLRYTLTAKEVSEEGMLCGGEVTVLLDYWTKDKEEVLDKLIMALESGETPWLLLGIPPSSKGCLLLTKGGAVGELKGIRAEVLDLSYIKRPTLLEIEGVELYVEPVLQGPTLYLFGAGHVSKELAPLAKKVGFRVVVVDDRAEFANKERFPTVDEVIVQDFEEASRNLPLGPESYVVIVTRGHEHDYTVLRNVLGFGTKYIGMIGSKRKRDIIFEKLKGEGVPPELLSRVRSPIGLDIGAESPEEIAISIVAELIAFKNLVP